MRRKTSDYIKSHRGEVFVKKTGTLTFQNIKTEEIIPPDVAEELDRLNKFERKFVNFRNEFIL